MKRLCDIEQYKSMLERPEKVVVNLSRERNQIHLIIVNQEDTLSYLFTVEQWLDLNGGIISPAELATQYGPKRGGKNVRG